MEHHQEESNEVADEQKLEKWKDEALGERMLWKSRQRRDSTECRGGEAL